MPAPLFDRQTLKELFKTASVWRGAVIGAAIFTALAVIFPPSSPHPRSTYTPPPTAPTPQNAATPQAPAIPTGNAPPAAANSTPLTPVAPAVPKILPSAQADAVAEGPKQAASKFGEVKDGEQPEGGHIKPEQPDEN